MPDTNVITNDDIKKLAADNGVEYAALKAVINVESSGKGFDAATGKIIIQFEPVWFRRIGKNPDDGGGQRTWAKNKVEKQPGEWAAFNDAFSINPDAAMQSTSIGLMQVMGFHYQKLGFATVGAMWDHAKESEANQVDIGLRFIRTKGNEKLYNAMKTKDWATFAFYYNGAQYKMFKYDTRLADAYQKALV
ncbi:MAG: hypothetical protein K0Q79_1556 [Flavipsychrobacter sp.]|jgi:hypothetical protein|nr:hypothetical protein [Flavipsychrobacter sp.]